MKEFTRALPTEFEVMGRTIEGLALSWNRPYRVSDDGGATYYAEGWRSRAFDSALPATGNVFELRVDHRDERVGRTQFRAAGDGLVFTAVIDNTLPGDAALDTAKANRFRGVSLRYASANQRSSPDGVVWRTHAVPRELSLIQSIRPQYDDAGIVAVRAIDDEVDEVVAAGVAFAADRERVAALLSLDVEVL